MGMKPRSATVPYVGFSNDTLDAAPRLGATLTCDHCGQEHEVKQSVPPMLQFYKCGDSTYLAGIRGADVRSRKADVSGSIPGEP